MHRALESLDDGEWTTYGDLARLMGSAPLAVGQHVARCDECVGAWRVLGAGGRSRAGFAWTDISETRTQRQLLEAEGLLFGADGGADRAALVDVDELRLRLAGDATD